MQKHLLIFEKVFLIYLYCLFGGIYLLIPIDKKLCQKYNIKMFGKCIKKIDNFIQWTKNWQFLHILAICHIPFLMLLILALYDNKFSNLFTFI